MNLDETTKRRLLEKTLGEGKIYFFRKGADLGGGSGTDNHPHACIKIAGKVLVMTVASARQLFSP